MNVVVLGELCEDILMHNPNSVEVFEQKIWAKDVTVTAGGSAVYVSQALSRMGVDVRLCAVVGDDESGKRMLRDLQAFPVDCSMVRMLPNSDTTRSIVICDGPEKDFKGCSPMLPLYIPDIEDLGGAELLYVAGYVLYPELWTAEARDLLKKAKERGITVALDVQMFPVEGIDQLEFSHLEGVLPYVDIFFAARKEMLGLLKTEDPAGLHRGSLRYGRLGRYFRRQLLLRRYERLGQQALCRLRGGIYRFEYWGISQCEELPRQRSSGSCAFNYRLGDVRL